MRFNCIICTDLFVPSSDISSTECGHLFHSHCIMQWLERSKTCPQCRGKTHDKKLIKIFLDCSETSSEASDPNQLQNELDSLRFRLSLKTTEYNKAEEERQLLKEQHAGLRSEIKKLEKAGRSKDDTITAMKMQLQCFGDIAREKQKARDECDKLRARLRLLSNVETVVSQSTAEVSDMLSAYSNDSAQAAKDMATYCLVLKRELTSGREEQRRHSDDRHRLKTALQESRADAQRLQRRLEQLESAGAAAESEIASLEEENTRLHKQVKALEAAVVSPSGDPKNSALSRLLSENCTPSDLRSRPVLTSPDGLEVAAAQESDSTPSGSGVAGGSSQDTEDEETPRLALKTVTLNPAAAGAAGPSPLLRVKSASVAAGHARLSGSQLSRNPFTAPARAATDFSRLKNKNLLTQNLHRADFAARAGSPSTSAVKRPSADCGWDGFGGSSRPDTFPQRQKKVKVKLKNGGQVMKIDNFFAL
ncbi:E3 ubiquitin-protein ligase TRAIP-like isoform X1 [Amphibalanus amphitrite]|uniref:E3 ubiquitin-protein ligase TRAIP-like isoform X1 n=2 Tax=Amphibalanus amphitrite TaxID=1232801 RepID=UPI001C9005A2|nr:E3 ubiquitin-protein ligase TRAIP-like isoform X1 [Amphibalanus amphitrite]